MILQKMLEDVPFPMAQTLEEVQLIEFVETSDGIIPNAGEDDSFPILMQYEVNEVKMADGNDLVDMTTCYQECSGDSQEEQIQMESEEAEDILKIISD